MSNLLPCPFCGAGADEGSRGHIEVRSNGHGHWAQCWHCKTQGPAQSTDELAVMAWNTRAGGDREAELKKLLTDIESRRDLAKAQAVADTFAHGCYLAYRNSADAIRAALSPQEQDEQDEFARRYWRSDNRKD